MKKLAILFTFAFLAAGAQAQWLTPQQKQKADVQSGRFTSFLDELARHNPAKRVTRATVQIPGGYGVECSAALVNEKGVLALDTPCTEALARAFVELQTAPFVSVRFPALTFYLHGDLFAYQGYPIPADFNISDGGFAFFSPNMPDGFFRALKGLEPLPPSDNYLAALFRSLPAPETANPHKPQGAQQTTVKFGDVSAFQKFLDTLEQDLREYVKHFASRVWMGEPAKDYTDRDINKYDGMALILNAKGLTAAFPFTSSINFRQAAQENKGALRVRLNLKNLGVYERPQGVPYYFNGTVRRIRPLEKIGDGVLFSIPFTPGSEVRNALKRHPAINNHRVGTWWLEDFYPRIERALKFVEAK